LLQKGQDTKTNWLTDRRSQCDFDNDFDFDFPELLVSALVNVVVMVIVKITLKPLYSSGIHSDAVRLLPGIAARLKPAVQMIVRLRHVVLMDMVWWPPKGIAISRNRSMDRNTSIRTDTCG
jgi:hypothetical protein